MSFIEWLRFHFCFIFILGDNHISPAILDQLWKDEEDKRNSLEQKVREYLKEKKVCNEVMQNFV